MTKHKSKSKQTHATQPKLKDGDKNWESQCFNCGSVPTVEPTGLCGPCCFGEADTSGGNW